MRKALLFVFFLVLFTLMITVPGTAKRINLLGAVGIASSGLDDLLLDFGVEFQMAGEFYLQLVANNHFGDGGYRDYPYYPYSFYGSPYNASVGVSSSSLHGLNAFGVYRLPLSRKMTFFGKAGLSLMFYSTYDYNIEINGWSKSKANGPGAAFGSGFEYSLSEKIYIALGSTYKTLFKKETSLDWFKFYIGFNYRLKK